MFKQNSGSDQSQKMMNMPALPPIDNSNLLAEDKETLRPSLQENDDFKLLTKDQWESVYQLWVGFFRIQFAILAPVAIDEAMQCWTLWSTLQTIAKDTYCYFSILIAIVHLMIKRRQKKINRYGGGPEIQRDVKHSKQSGKFVEVNSFCLVQAVFVFFEEDIVETSLFVYFCAFHWIFF
jgi:hypothetical protein